jgi:glyoxylase-like metal-dependent hydrolase (beta-lactamase superfamily II)
MSEAITFSVGSTRCIAVHDGDTQYRAQDYVANADPGVVATALERHRHPPDAIPSPYSGLVVQTGDRVVLIDTGAGNLTPSVGHLTRNLSAAGIGAEQVDTVVITHAHPDHIGGNADDAGQPAFPNARYTLWRDEWTWWTSEENLAPMAPVFGEWVRRHLVPLADRVELLDRELELEPGVHLLATPGHTEGHIAVSVASEGEELLYISDAALHPIHLEHPDWHPVWDQDRDLAAASKRRLFDHAADSGALVLAFHFPPFPSLGHVEKRGNGWHWEARSAP